MESGARALERLCTTAVNIDEIVREGGISALVTMINGNMDVRFIY